MRVALLALAVWAGPAMAQERPLLQPTQDVAITYRLDGAAADILPGGPAGALRLFWDAQGQRMRLEADGRPQALLVDLQTRGAQIVDSGLRSYVALPVRDAEMQAITLSGAQMTRRGTETVAGLTCTVWAVQSPRGSGTVCMTADGVALRATGDVDGRRGGFTAMDVRYAEQPVRLFQVPAGYMSFSIPGLGRPR